MLLNKIKYRHFLILYSGYIIIYNSTYFIIIITMQTLSLNLNKNTSNFLKNNNPKNINLYNYNREDIKIGILHIGVGGFHRSHQAFYIHKLIQQHNELDWGICGVGIMPQDEVLFNALKE